MTELHTRHDESLATEPEIPLYERVTVAAGLGAVSLTACVAQRYGITNQLDTPLEQISESLAHPLFGYVGGLIGSRLTRGKKSSTQTVASFVSTTAANFTAEIGQAMTVQIPGEGHFWSERQLPETTKDYVFALLGLGLYYLHRPRK